MWLYYISILLIIVSNIFYHFIQKTTPADVNPLIALIVTYATAILACILLLPFFPEKAGLVDSFKKLNWTSFALGLTVVGLEAGFLLAYRAGWNISFAGLFAHVVVALLLIPIGILWFKEHVTMINIAGLLLCIAGLVLLTRK